MAAFDGSVAAPLMDFYVGLIFICDLLCLDIAVFFCLVRFSLVASLRGVLPVK